MELPFDIKSIECLKFMPTDQILLEQYLYNKVNGLPYFGDVVFDYDLYGVIEPWQIWELFKGVDSQDLYFFTQLKRSTNKSGQPSSHVNRKVGPNGGTWSAENSLTPIFSSKINEEVNITGYCRRLRYENPNFHEHHGEWIMHEYSLPENFIQDCQFPNYVLCRIRKNERVKRKANKIKRVTTHIESHERYNKRLETINSFVVPSSEQSIMTPTSEQRVDENCELIFETPEDLESHERSNKRQKTINSFVVPSSEQSIMTPTCEQRVDKNCKPIFETPEDLERWLLQSDEDDDVPTDDVPIALFYDEEGELFVR